MISGEAHGTLPEAPAILGNAGDVVGPFATMLAFAMFVCVAFGLPLLGYCAMGIEIRRYLRSLTKALVAVTSGQRPGQPYWARLERPPCLEALDLAMPCSEEQVLAAYRKRVKLLHPDHGGNLQQFLKLQKHFEQAMYIARNHKRPVRTASMK